MEASVRLFNSSSFRRSHPLKLAPISIPRQFPATPRQPHSLSRVRSSSSSSSSSITSQNLTFLGFLPSLASSIHPPISAGRFDPVASHASNGRFFEWHYGGKAAAGNLYGGGDSVTVVLLGWLGAKQKHLKRYVDLYTSRGINAVTFVVPVREVLSFDLGRRVEERISVLSREIESWIAERDEDGRERSMVFHTFSNTGWLVYGAILDNLQGRQDVIERIEGCVVDSGPEPELNPKVVPFYKKSVVGLLLLSLDSVWGLLFMELLESFPLFSLAFCKLTVKIKEIVALNQGVLKTKKSFMQLSGSN